MPNGPLSRFTVPDLTRVRAEHGEHTAQALAEFGFGAEEIADLAEKGVTAANA